MIVLGRGKYFSFSSGVSPRGKLGRRKVKRFSVVAMLCMLPVLVLSSGSSFADGWLGGDSDSPGGNAEFPSRAGNVIKDRETFGVRGSIGGIANTRHNLTMSYSGAVVGLMDGYRNDYYEICVYCHTPHGANSTAAAPLWNRTVTSREYILYQDKSSGNDPAALTGTFSQPGPNSLTCLSCHDGVTAIDSIINMPTQLSGEFRAGYQREQETGVDSAFLDRWSGNALGTGSPGDPSGVAHAALGGPSTCLACHSPPADGAPALAPDFENFVIGIDLADDHPIGVTYPTKFNASVDFNEPDIKTGRIAFFDINGNAHADPDEIRLYDTGDGYEVECGSCHDPHGVRVRNSAALGVADQNKIVPSFLRVGSVDALIPNTRARPRANVGSNLCLTCHVK